MKSFATSICPIKNFSCLEYEALCGSPAWRTIPQPISKRFLSGVITGLRHVDLAYRHLSGIPAWRSVLLIGLRHGDLAYRCLRGSPAPSLHHPRAIPVPSQCYPRAIPASSPPGKSVFYRMLADSGPFSWTSRCSLGALVGLRHGDLAYRCFRAISAWRSSHLSALRHGDLAQRCLRGILAWQSVLLTGLWHGDPARRCLSGILAESL